MEGARVQTISGRLLIRFTSHASLPGAIERLRTIFGLSSFSPAIQIKAPTMDSLVRAAIGLAGTSHFESFKVRSRRGHCSFGETSNQVNIVVGQALKDHTKARVDLSHAEWTCHIELVGNWAYLYTEKIPGPGGLPVGTSGRVLCLLSGGIDSPVAAWRIARRGALVDFVHFHGQPFSDNSSARQATRLARHLAPWTLRSKLWMIQFGEIQSEIVTTAPQELRVVLYRRFMMRIAEALALQQGHQSLVTGECLGQVASQTLPNLAAIQQVVERLPVLRPLIGFDKLEIEHTGKLIGTYEISIEDHQDCCTLFIPRRVSTAAKLADLLEAESVLDVQAMVGKAVANAEMVDCTSIG